MRRKRVFLLVLALQSLWAASARAGEDVVYLRAPGPPEAPGCAAITCASGTQCCFTTTGDLVTWLFTGRSQNLDSEHPVAVEVGPGTFDALSMTCNATDQGYVTFRGAGRDHTTFVTSGAVIASPAIYASGCSRLQFMDLTAYGLVIAIHVAEASTVVFDNVDARASMPANSLASQAFKATCSGSGQTQATTWTSTRLFTEVHKGLTSRGLHALCGKHEFYGSQIRVQAGSDVRANTKVHGVDVLGASTDVELFGSSILVELPPGLSNRVVQLRGISATTGATVEMHSGIINVSPDGLEGPGEPNSVVPAAIVAQTGAAVRAFGTGYAFGHAHAQGGNLDVIRLDDNHADPPNQGTIEAPFVWPPGTDAPNLQSLDGQDLFVETDCCDAQCSTSPCQGGAPANRAHLMIYNPAHCPASNPWLDAVRKECRD